MNADLLEDLAERIPFHLINPSVLVLWCLLTIGFVMYYVKRNQEVGPLSLDTYFVIRFLFIPIVFMFPFAHSAYNVDYSRLFIAPAWSFLQPAFFVGAIGIAAFFVGAWVRKYIHVPIVGFDYFEESFRGFWTTRRGVIVGVVMSLGLISVLLVLGLEFGRARQASIQAPLIRPLFNLWHTIHPFIVLNVLVYAFIRCSTVGYGFGILLALIGLFGATRHASIEPLAIFILLVFFYLGKQVKLRRIVPIGVAIIVVAVYVGGIRHGQYGIPDVSRVAGKIFYGDNFNELRDTAWIMSGWDGKFLLGKSQAAALMSFVPSRFSAFREENKFSKFTLKSSGLINLKNHPGLRPIIFGATFFNFGMAGAIIAGLLSGLIVFTLADLIQQRAAETGVREKITVCLTGTTYLGFLLCALSTCGFFGVYVLVFLLVAGRFVARTWPQATGTRWIGD